MAFTECESVQSDETEYFDLLVREAESERRGLEPLFPSSRTLLNDVADRACLETMSQAMEMDIVALVEISSQSDPISSCDTSETAREVEDQLLEDNVLAHNVYESIIIVEVSPIAKQFPVYKHQLCAESRYFRDTSMSYGLSNERDWLAGIIRLPELDARIFRFFLYWLYWLYNDVFTTYEDADLVSYPQLIELYILGEKLHVPVLKNVVLDSLASECLVQEKPIPTSFTQHIYHETPKRSPLRRLWVDFYAWKLNPMEFENEEAAGKVDNRFLRDLAGVQMRMIREEEFRDGHAEPPSS
ncbi:MAG: hypothetical protein M1830_008481 [Pleopsidium flavum]|nr:MAG: hypothetical protein M1830_008481 [Pleopsidium flavum]